MGTRNVYVVEKVDPAGNEFVDLVETISPSSAVSFVTKPLYTARLITARELANMLLANDKVEIKQDKRGEEPAVAGTAT